MVVLFIGLFTSISINLFLAHLESKKSRLQKQLIEELKESLRLKEAINEQNFHYLKQYFEGLYRLDHAVGGMNDATVKLFEDTPFERYLINMQLEKEIQEALNGG